MEIQMKLMKVTGLPSPHHTVFAGLESLRKVSCQKLEGCFLQAKHSQRFMDNLNFETC
jgi:hypothetical protein